MVLTSTTERVSTIVRVAGILLLVPAALLIAFAFCYPAMTTLFLSLQEGGMVGRASFAGLSNYRTLLHDPAPGAALGRSVTLALARLLAVLIVPALAGWAWARQQRWLRIAGRLAMSVPLALSAPVALALLWAAIAPALGLGALPPQAERSQLVFEFLSFLGLGGALTATALTLAWRAARPARPVLGVLGLAGIVAFASGMESLTFALAVSGGGPARTSETVAYYAFRLAFHNLDLGQAAAVAIMPLVIGLGLGLAFGLLAAALDLRLVPATGGSPERVSWPRLVVGLPALALLVLPVVLLYLWGGGSALLTHGNPLGQAASSLQLRPALVNGAAVPALVIALVQLPASYLAALSLGLLRPFGPRWSRVALALLLAGGFVPPIVVAIGLFPLVQQLGLLNTLPGLVLPLLAGPAGLYIFALHFAGRRPAFERACQEGRSPWSAFFHAAFLPSLPVGVLAAAVSFLVAGQSLVWPLVIQSRLDQSPLSLQILALSWAGTQPALQQAGAWLLLTSWGAAMLLVWWLLQALVVERLALVSGREVDKGE
jgi:ABC-type sugar transport system permease subunit